MQIVKCGVSSVECKVYTVAWRVKCRLWSAWCQVNLRIEAIYVGGDEDENI